MAQVTPTNIVYALVDSSDWIEGVELRLCMTPPKQPFQRCHVFLLISSMYSSICDAIFWNSACAECTSFSMFSFRSAIWFWLRQ